MKQLETTRRTPKRFASRVRNLALGLGALLVMGASACQSGAPAAHAIDHREAFEKGAIIVDVRTPAEFASGHLEGAVNIPVDALASRVGELPADKTVIVYCRSGRRSAAAASFLEEQGREVIDIGTMANW